MYTHTHIYIPGNKKKLKCKMSKLNFFMIQFSMKMFQLHLSLLDLEQKTVCCPLIHDQALSDPARHASRPRLLKDTSHRHFHTTPPPPPPPAPTTHHHHPRADSHTLPQSSYLSWQTGLQRMLQVRKISSASWRWSIRIQGEGGQLGGEEKRDRKIKSNRQRSKMLLLKAYERYLSSQHTKTFQFWLV